MLTPERHRMILDMLQEKGIVKIQELVQATASSEATIRRDLSHLESENLLKRVHGGAALLQGKGMEASLSEKSTKQLSEKKRIARLAASLIQEGDCIYLDAGSTTYEMIPLLVDKKITVVTNGLMHLESLYEYDIQAYVVGGKIKGLTKALVGSQAIRGLQDYRFDKCFIGTNGIHEELGYTTPDPEEASIKKMALQLSEQRYVIADRSKWNKVCFVQFAAIQEAALIIDQLEQDEESAISNKTTVIKVVE
ncbi:DeoR/GlpR family DNA-binding transcription regulator [Paenibacillus aquistagni]|uniref:Transcriptional regulator, DeoR family n=1 Tax=Paenibacillus aquistagni TaxID=1852522 RepID=A0A1X7LGE3_9BACL|nr:transcriptional regulator, DeoR family [Paenibacillus aquistagni]